jgi:hypothetical protein
MKKPSAEFWISWCNVCGVHSHAGARKRDTHPHACVTMVNGKPVLGKSKAVRAILKVRP